MTHAKTLNHLLRLLARSRRVLDYMADETQQGRPLNRNDAGTAQDLACDIVAQIGHSVTDQPEAPEMFALREHLDELADREGYRERIADILREWVYDHGFVELPDAPGEIADRVLAALAGELNDAP